MRGWGIIVTTAMGHFAMIVSGGIGRGCAGFGTGVL
jgi:hypothetical protein